MGEKAKKAFIEILNSDEVRGFFDDLFESQTDSIRQAVLDAQKEELTQVEKKNEELSDELLKLNGELEKIKNEKKRLEDDVKGLNSELIQKVEEVTSLQERKRELEIENKKIAEQKEESERLINTEYKRIKEKCEYLEMKYGLMEKVVDSYGHLSAETIARTKNIMGNGEIYDFVSLSREWKNVEGLWTFIKRKIIEEDIVDIDALISIFECLFEFNQGCTGVVNLELIKINIGTKYDSDVQSIIGIKTDGIVEEVLLPGIREKISRRVIQKALVKV